jgi:hypothetical protein
MKFDQWVQMGVATRRMRNSISRLKISLSVSPCRATALSAAHLRDLFNLEME